MTTQLKIDTIANSELFTGIDLPGITAIANNSEIIEFPANYKIIKQGEINNSVYIIISGEINITKSHNSEELIISTLKHTQTFGESGLLKKHYAIANVITNTPVKLLRIPYIIIKNTIDIYRDVCVNIASSYSDRLNYTNAVTLLHYKQREDEFQKRIRLGTFLIDIIIALSIYIGVLMVYNRYHINSANFNTTFITSILLIILFLCCLIILNNQKIPLEKCGVSLDVSRQAIMESILYTGFVFIILILLKILYLFIYSKISLRNIFDFYPMYDHNGAYMGMYYYFLAMGIYSLFVPIQEFLYRGCLQGVIHNYYHDNNKLHKWQAIFIANVVFTASHAHIYGYELPVFLLGFFWGWLYFRSQNLIPVCISHILIAIWAFFIVGFTGIVN